MLIVTVYRKYMLSTFEVCKYIERQTKSSKADILKY